MTADHPTREERYENLIEFVRTFETGEQAANALPIFLVAADCADGTSAEVSPERSSGESPAPAQPAAALSDEEREALGDWWDSDWPADAPHVLVTLYATVERILAARAAQPVPAPEVPRGVAEGEWVAARFYGDPCPTCRTQHQAEMRPLVEVKAEALREAADLLQFTADPPHVPTWLRSRADLLVLDALGGERGEG